ncbi:Glutamyl-tRNA(Gln) amidotransferase subunit A [Seminavis robusta]|uniref:Glutamyl-tRNA(Gln) amidotransferase subunit A n=1 Tax=Seminavis robusta TaxID=568900 RepID=A0A9N8HLS1_9STRA|nr:Glutamyl-tRNA(Gln) amidotransferase subunit A [Seminavis robusta]|eukprot:Sro835_g208790.1 Glutamyl-tRNA(Gln) amidotransferase subunit A (579) ;mRNA; r:8167-9903
MSSPSLCRSLTLLPHRASWSLRAIVHLISTHQLTCEELARYCHSTAVAGDQVWELGAFSRISSWEDIAQAARESDQRRANQEQRSPLDGIPISIKANLAVADHPLTAGSRILGAFSNSDHNNHNVGYNAAVVQRLVEDCGAICIGITNMDEFGMGSLGTNTSNSKPTKNPLAYLTSPPPNAPEMTLAEIVKHDPSDILKAHQEQQQQDQTNNNNYAAGGSSCGAAASIAHGSSLIAFGSDTGGSIRLPAAWCGVVGLKPSYGRLSRHGLVSYASSLDTVGFVTPTVDCASMVLEELAADKSIPKDSTSHVYSTTQRNNKPQETITREEPTTHDSSNHPLQGIRIGIPAAFCVEECPDAVQKAWTQGANDLADAGASVVHLSHDIVSPEMIQQSLAAYYVLACAEASSNLARYDGFRYGVAAETAANDTNDDNDERSSLHRQYAATRTTGFGLEVIRRILCGTAVLSSDKFHTHYEGAAKLRALVTRQLHNALETHVDYLLIPTVVSPPPCLDEEAVDSTAMFANDIMTVPISLAGLAAVSVAPDTATVDGVVGLQLVGHRLDEERLLEVARYLARQAT